MKTINKNDWRYKIINAMFATEKGWMPKNSCQFHFYTILAVLVWPIIVFPEALICFIANDFGDVKMLINGQKRWNTNKWSLFGFAMIMNCIFLFLSGLLTVVSLASLMLPNNTLTLLTFSMILVYATIIRYFIIGCQKLKGLCKPITYIDPEN